MKIKYIEWIYVVRNNSFFQVGIDENVSENMFETSDELIGYGIEGYLVASFFAVLNRKDVAFCRRKAKNHGTGNRIDGVIKNKSYTLVCLEGDISCAVDMIKDSVSITNIIVIYLRSELIDDLTCYDFRSVTSRKEEKMDLGLLDYVNLLSDRSYLLSSGKTIGYYYETLPAANTYELIEYVFSRRKDCFINYDVYVGIGYGGVFFSMFAAMKMKKRLYVYYDNGSAEGTPINISFNTQDVLLFDDFISTGGSIMRAVREGKIEKYKGIVLYAKNGFGTNNSTFEICKYIE